MRIRTRSAARRVHTRGKQVHSLSAVAAPAWFADGSNSGVHQPPFQPDLPSSHRCYHTSLYGTMVRVCQADAGLEGAVESLQAQRKQVEVGTGPTLAGRAAEGSADGGAAQGSGPQSQPGAHGSRCCTVLLR